MASLQTARRSRGRLDSNGRVIRTCSIQYLHKLCIEMLRTMAQHFVAVATVGEEIQRAVFVIDETQRLLQNPGLFPSDAVRVSFLALLSLDAELQINEALSELVIESEISNLEQARERNYSRRLYAADLMPWENFLLNMAPGAPNDPLHRAVTEPKSSFQMVPAIGLRIVADFEREEQDVIQFVQRSEASIDIKPAQSTLLVDFEKGVAGEEIPRDQTVQYTQKVTAEPNPYRPGRTIREDVCIEPAQPVENVAHFLHHIDASNAPPTGPRGVNNSLRFPMYSVRQWYPPSQLRDLRFFRNA